MGEFMNLLEVKDLNKITVSEICKNCNINRSTFYANFLDVYDLADKIREMMHSEVEQLYEAERSLGYNSQDYLKLFNHIKEHQELYNTYFKLGFESEPITYYDEALAKSHFNDKHIKYHIEFFRCGLNKIIKMWLEGGCKESPEEMKEIIDSEYCGRADLFR